MTERNMGEESQGSGKLGKADRRKKRYRALFILTICGYSID